MQEKLSDFWEQNISHSTYIASSLVYFSITVYILYLLYFVWVDQRVHSSITAIMYEVGSYWDKPEQAALQYRK